MTAWKISLRAGARSSPLLAKLSPKASPPVLFASDTEAPLAASQAAPGARGTVEATRAQAPEILASGFHSHPASAEDADAEPLPVHGIRPTLPGARDLHLQATTRDIAVPDPNETGTRPTAGGPPRPRPPAAPRRLSWSSAGSLWVPAPRNQARAAPRVGAPPPATDLEAGSLFVQEGSTPTSSRAVRPSQGRATSHAMDERADAAAAPRRPPPPLLFRKSHRRKSPG